MSEQQIIDRFTTVACALAAEHGPTPTPGQCAKARDVIAGIFALGVADNVRERGDNPEALLLGE